MFSLTMVCLGSYTDGWMDGWMDGFMDLRMLITFRDFSTYTYIYICIYIYIQ